MIDIKELQTLNAQRAARWHPLRIQDWSTFEWTGAMAGEVGEACNAAKKLKRVETEIQHLDGRWSPVGDHAAQIEHYKREVAKESCDTILYAILCVERVGHDVETVLKEVFNKKSEQYGFPERL